MHAREFSAHRILRLPQGEPQVFDRPHKSAILPRRRIGSVFGSYADMTLLVPGVQGIASLRSPLCRSARTEIGCAASAPPMVKTAAAATITLPDILGISADAADRSPDRPSP